MKQDARALWNKELNKVVVSSKDEKFLRTFYTAAFHTMIAPSLYNNADGSFLGTDKVEYTGRGFDNYSVFSLWDTYRAAHPL